MFRWLFGEAEAKKETHENLETSHYVVVAGAKNPKINSLAANFESENFELVEKPGEKHPSPNNEFLQNRASIEKQLQKPTGPVLKILEQSRALATRNANEIDSHKTHTSEIPLKISPSTALDDMHKELKLKVERKSNLSETIKTVFLLGQYQSSYLKRPYAEVLKTSLEKILRKQHAIVTTSTKDRTLKTTINSCGLRK